MARRRSPGHYNRGRRSQSEHPRGTNAASRFGQICRKCNCLYIRLTALREIVLTCDSLRRELLAPATYRMAVLSELRYPTTRLAKILSGLLATAAFPIRVACRPFPDFCCIRSCTRREAALNVDLSVMMGHPTTFSFPSPDGGTRDGWFYPGLRGAPTIMVCHGYHSQRADVLTLVTALQEHAVQCFLFDFTGHGSSPGVTTLGYRESAELQSAMQALATRDDVDPKHFGLWGVDMGGYAVLECGLRDQRVAAFVVDDAYDDPRDMVQIEVKSSGLDGAAFCEQVLRSWIPDAQLSVSEPAAGVGAARRNQGNSEAFLRVGRSARSGART